MIGFFKNQIKVECNLDLKPAKCEVFTWFGELPPESLPGFVRAGVTEGGVFYPGFLCVGTPLGSDECVQLMMEEKLTELREEANRIVAVLGDEKQAL